MRGFGIAGCGCCSESCGRSRGLRTFRRLWRRGRGHVPGAKAPTLGWVGMPRLKPGPISEATTREEADSSAALHPSEQRPLAGGPGLRNDKQKATLREGLGAVGATVGVGPDDTILVRAVAFVAGLADLIGDCGELIRGIAILVVEGDLGAADDGEGVAALPASGGERWVDELRGLCGGCAGAGIATQGGQGAGVAVGGVGDVVGGLSLPDGVQHQDCGGLVGALLDREQRGNEEREEEQNEDEQDTTAADDGDPEPGTAARPRRRGVCGSRQRGWGRRRRRRSRAFILHDEEPKAVKATGGPGCSWCPRRGRL